jgi:hypothetical protein
VHFIIDGTEYDAVNLERVTARDALELTRQTGVGLQSLVQRLGELGRLSYDATGRVVVMPEGSGIEGDPNAVVDSERHLSALLAFLWLSRRLGGERSLTFDQACDFVFTTLQVGTDVDDVPLEESPDPIRPSASAPADGPDEA